jgi:flagellar motor switch protein FliG
MKIPGRVRAAAVLISLDSELAVRLLRDLPGVDLRELTRSMSELRRLGMDTDSVHAVLEEFRESMGTTVAPQLRSLLERAFGANRAHELVKELEAEGRGKRPFDMLERLDGLQVSVMVADEHPQLVALVVSHLEQPQAVDLLSELSPERRVDVLRRLATMSPASPDALQRLSIFLAHKSERERRGQQEAVTPGSQLKTVADLLNKLEGGQDLLESLSDGDQELAKKIKDLMFVFEDLSGLDRKSMQKLLSRVDSKLLAMSLKAATPPVEENMLKNLSQRARDAVLEERSLLGPTPIKEVQAAQRDIMGVVQEMAAAGEIQIGSGGETEYV